MHPIRATTEKLDSSYLVQLEILIVMSQCLKKAQFMISHGVRTQRSLVSFVVVRKVRYFVDRCAVLIWGLLQSHRPKP